MVKKWFESGILALSGQVREYGLGEAIVVTCSEHITHDTGLYAKDSIVIAVNSGAVKLKPHEVSDDRDGGISHQFLLDQIDQAIHTGCEHCPALPIILIADIPCRFADDEMTGIVDRLDCAIRGKRELAKAGCQVSCLLRVSSPHNTVFYTVNDSKWDEWYRRYEIDVLGRQDDAEEDVDGPKIGDAADFVESLRRRD